MSKSPQHIDISGVRYSSCQALGKNHNLLDRLAASGKIGKVKWNGLTFYEAATAEAAYKEMQAIPKGYVRLSDLADSLGVSRSVSLKICDAPRAPVKKVLTGKTKPAWYVDKAWFESKVDPHKLATPRTVPNKPTPRGQTLLALPDTGPTLAQLQQTVQELREVVKALSAKQVQVPASNSVVPAGYKPARDLVQELQVASSTVSGWKDRGHVRSVKINGVTYLNIEDTERMYLKLDDNRAVMDTRLGGKAYRSTQKG